MPHFIRHAKAHGNTIRPKTRVSLSDKRVILGRKQGGSQNLRGGKPYLTSRNIVLHPFPILRHFLHLTLSITIPIAFFRYIEV